MRLCLELPGSDARDDNSRGEIAMYPGLSDADCQVAAFNYRQLVDEGQRQRVAARVRPVSGVNRWMSGSVRRQVGTLLLHAGQRLQRAPVVTRVGPGLPVPGTNERGAIA